MSGPSRNDPCPCGSGRKYKQCCLRRDEAERARRRHRDQGAALALEWLTARHPEAYEAAVMDGFLGALGEADRESLGDLGAEERGLIDQNIGEWLLADGVLELEEGGEKVEREVAALVLGAGGPALADDQRALIAALAATPLRLHEVVATRPGVALTLRDALEPAGEVELADPGLASLLEPGEFAGLRLLALDGAPETSGALYAFSPAAGAELLARLRETLSAFAVDAGGEEARLRREAVTEGIVDHWLAGMAGAPDHEAHAHAPGAAHEEESR